MNRLLVLFLAGCSSDFGLQTFEPPVPGGDDTAAPDTAAPEPAEDTGYFEEVEEPEPAEEEEEEKIPEEDEPPEDDCTETSDLIYVIDRDLERLSLFDPETLTFSHLGILDCPRGSATPGSMAISRSGMAYVRYSDNQVYEVSLDDLSCTQTDYSSGSFGSFGMGYATNDADTWRDQLYIANSSQVALLGTDDWSRDVFGGMPSQSELTGTSSGELWAFLPLESPAMLAEIDKDTGAVGDRIRMSNFPNLGDIDTFAFAAWGGTFWLFVRTYGMGSSTDVFHVSTSGTLHRVLEDVGFDVVGAGASTCAPSK
jgi:hypothetical protein